MPRQRLMQGRFFLTVSVWWFLRYYIHLRFVVILIHNALSRDISHRCTLASRNSWNNPAPSLLRGYAKVEPLSISKLNKFVLTAKPQVVQHWFVLSTESLYSVCDSHEFAMYGNWFCLYWKGDWNQDGKRKVLCLLLHVMYTRKLQRTVISFTFVSRNNTKAIGVLRYIGQFGFKFVFQQIETPTYGFGFGFGFSF